MQIDTVEHPAFNAPNEGVMRTMAFDWLLRDVVPQGLTMLDLGAGPCVFASHAVVAGYHVTAVDGRTERLPADLDERIKFVQADVRSVTVDGYDVVALLGLLYHLALPEQIDLLRNIGEGTLILDTQIHVPEAVTEAAGEWAQHVVTTDDGYEGVLFPEGDNPMASIGNPESFWHTEPSLLRLLKGAGFRTCRVIDPLYVSKYGARKFYVLG